jgi:hypothetical protein
MGNSYKLCPSYFWRFIVIKYENTANKKIQVYCKDQIQIAGDVLHRHETRGL